MYIYARKNIVLEIISRLCSSPSKLTLLTRVNIVNSMENARISCRGFHDFNHSHEIWGEVHQRGAWMFMQCSMPR